MGPKKIVLAHGILGFGDVHLILNYFNGVKDHLERQLHEVHAPGVNPIGRVAERGHKLADAIREIPGRKKDLHIIAHSMGGLDARYAIAREPGVVERVKTLVTIGTPHLGSPVADKILSGLLRNLPDRTSDSSRRSTTAWSRNPRRYATGINTWTTGLSIMAARSVGISICRFLSSKEFRSLQHSASTSSATTRS